MRKRVFKKSELLREGYVRGLKEAKRIITRVLRESAEQDDLANIWAKNINERITECNEDSMNGEVPAISIGDEYWQMAEVQVEGDTVTIFTDEVDTFSFTKDALNKRTQEGAGFYLPVELVRLNGKSIDPARTDAGHVLFWEE